MNCDLLRALGSLCRDFAEACNLLGVKIRDVVLLLLTAFLAGYVCDALVQHIAVMRVPL
jgi:hypothetical protein